MKMSANLYNDLKNDIEKVCKFGAMGQPKNMRDLWDAFHAVMFDRMNDDNHPAFIKGRPRILSFWSHNGAKTRDEQESNKHWLNRFYVDEDLNDDHIGTALRKIKKELWGE